MSARVIPRSSRRTFAAPAPQASAAGKGPKVLGRQRARDLEARRSLAQMTGALQRAADAGEIEVENPELTARYLNAVLAEAAMAGLHAEPPLRQATIERSVRQVLEGLTPRGD